MSTRAIFLGSFNPPHKGHYDVVKSVINSGLMEKFDIRKIHVIPCWQNPNKQKFTASFVQRYQMCKFMFDDLIYDGLVYIDDVEEEICPSYTYELIRHFNSGHDLYINRYNEGFYWIITIETLKELLDEKWKNSTELLFNNDFIIVGRDVNELNNLVESYNKYYKNSIRTNFVKLTNEHDFHSTELREKVKDGKSIEDETNDKINQYIKEQKLYK